MKKNGFIATSILYSFFLVFITLFVALITNYLHNRVLLNAMDDIARETLDGIKNTKFSDLEVGDSVRFANNASPVTLNFALNDSAQWIVIEATPEANNRKTYYLLSDFTAQNTVVTRKMPGDIIALRHSVTLNVMEYLSNNSNPDGYRSDLQFYTKYTAPGTPNPYTAFDITLPKASVLARVRKSSSTPDAVKEAIFGVNGSYAVEIDGNYGGFNIPGKSESNAKYALYRRYNFTFKDEANDLVEKYCKAKYDRTSNAFNYLGTNAGDNGFGYTHVVREGVDGSGNKIGSYVDYCTYSSPVVYEHTTNEAVVGTYENQDDIIRNTNYAVTYQYRLMAKITVDVNSENTYISSGRGTTLDPYLMIDGVKTE